MELVQAQTLTAFELQPSSSSSSSCASSFNRFLEQQESSPMVDGGLIVQAEEEECVGIPVSSSVDLFIITTTTGGVEMNDGGQESTPSESTAAALKVQKIYRGYRTRRRLADSAVVAEELWWQAIDFARLNHSTISFFNFLKPETPVSRWNRVTLNASKVGKGLTQDAKAKKLAFQHWIEAIDPRHRYGHSLHYYYDEWCKGDAGQPFFYWLDIGDGREVDLEACPRSKLRKQSIKYLGPQERENYEYIVVDGKIVHKLSGDLMDTTKGSQDAKWIFVMSTFKEFYAGEKKKGLFHHSSFLAGGATLAAGRLVAEDGVLKSISAYSGHYRPTDENLDSFLTFLTENGVHLNEVQVRSSSEGYSEDNVPVTATNAADVSTEPAKTESNEVEEEEGLQSSKPAETENKGKYQRTLSGGLQRTLSNLQSPRAEVPKKVILQRINSKKAASSYQLGHQLSKWSTGAGPRIGCVADYPPELRQQALEFVSLSPKGSSAPSASRWPASFLPPTPRPTSDLQNADPITSFT